MKQVRIGFIGAGWAARNRHLVLLKDIPDVKLGPIWSRNPAKSREVAAEFGFARIVDDWGDIIQDPEVDAVVIATPPILHHPATLAALQADKHVLSQARMARNLKEAQEMTRAARASALVTALYPARPGLKGERVMLRLLHQEGFVGEIREVRVTGMDLTPPKETYEWARDPDVVGVHAMNLGMWVEVLNRWVGPATAVMATGSIHERKRKNYDGNWVDAAVPDSLAVVADLECGATASYHFSTSAAGGPGSRIEIYGSRGALAYQLFVEEIHGASGDGAGWKPIPIPTAEAGSQTIDTDFVQAIRTGSPVSPDFAEGLRYMEFCEAVALSMMTGSRVSLAELEPRMQSWGRFLD